MNLDRCPFCGSNSVKLVKKSELAGFTGLEDRVERHAFSGRCNVCNSRGPVASGKVIVSGRDRYESGLPSWATTDDDLIRKAAELWNGRKASIQPALPCEIGQKLWVLPYKMSGHIGGVHEAVVDGMEIRKDGQEYIAEPTVRIDETGECGIQIPAGAWGWLVFKTKEEAEKAWENGGKEEWEKIKERYRANQELYN